MVPQIRSRLPWPDRLERKQFAGGGWRGRGARSGRATREAEVKATGQARLEKPGSLAVLQLRGVHDEEHASGLKVGDRGEVMDELGALLLTDLRLPQFVEWVDHHDSSDRRFFRGRRPLDGTGPTAGGSLPQTALSQIRVDRFDAFGQTSEDTLGMAWRKNHETGGGLLA